MDRRLFLKMVGTAGVLGACSQVEEPVKNLVPFVIPPEDVVPGKSTGYASVCQQCPSGCGIVVKVQDGQAKKIEGNPLHPVNQGKLCALGESALQELYNPDRLQTPMKRIGERGSGQWEAVSWEQANQIVVDRLKTLENNKKTDALYCISRPLKGHLNQIFNAFLEGFGSPHDYRYTFLDDTVLQKANALCFGIHGQVEYDLAQTNYLLSFGANFLETWRAPVYFSKAYGDFRQGKTRQTRGKFVQCEARMSLTAANADQWVSLRPGSEGILALGVAHLILNKGWHDPGLSNQAVAEWRELLSDFKPNQVAKWSDVSEETLLQLAKDFSSIRPSLALCGDAAMAQKSGLFQAVAVNILNIVAGNIGIKGGVQFFDPFESIDENHISWKEIDGIRQKMLSGQVQALILHEANPLFHAPESLRLEDAFKNVPFIVSLSAFMDESSAFSDLVLPLHTPLESFGDLLPSVDGGRRSVGLMQPVVAPLYDTRHVGDILMHWATALEGSVSEHFPWDNFESFLKEVWEEYFFLKGFEDGVGFGVDFKPFWTELLQKGGRWDEKASKPKTIHSPDIPGLGAVIHRKPELELLSGDNFYFIPAPSIFHLDGRGANRPWLQEAPDPMTTITWGSWLEIHPDTAGQLDIREGDLIKISSPEGAIEAPAYLSPGIRPDTLSMPIGQGHTAYGRYAEGRGSNPLKIIVPDFEAETGALAWAGTRVKIAKTGKHVKIAKTEGHTSQMDHQMAMSVSAEEAVRLNQQSSLKPIEALPSRKGVTLPAFFNQALSKYFRPQQNNQANDYRWGMVIDLDRCTGCGACNVSCHAENNLPITGEEAVKTQREINWIRIERYWPKSTEKQETPLFLPMLCQHCGNAPCEPVCPVYATYHTPDGLNAQVYNRCVGTRYCANNCPYEARSFNFVQPEWPQPLTQQLSPDLSVRDAGVMEKCTFCVQRIRTAKEDAKIEKRRVRDGEIQPACVSACPADAMLFGSLLDHESAVSLAASDPRRYRALEHLNTESAVIYLKRIIDA